MNVKMTTTGVQ